MVATRNAPTEPEINQPFYTDVTQPGIVRGGFYDRDGGMLVGAHARWVCEVLNAAIDAKASSKPVDESLRWGARNGRN